MAKRLAQMQITWEILSACARACIKISAVFFYRRIFCVSGNKTGFSVVTLPTATMVFLWLVTFLFLIGFQCGSHFSAMWDGTYLQYCTMLFPLCYGLVISDLLLDVWILALPVPQILKLHTTRQRKAAITGVFLLAFVGLGASIARDAIYVPFLTAGPETLLKYDEEVTLTKGLYFSMLEGGMSLVAVNLISLSFLMSKKALGISLHSIRSVFAVYSSASSKRPSASNNPSYIASKGDVKDSFSTSSRSNLARHTDRDMYERFEMHDQVVLDMEKGV